MHANWKPRQCMLPSRRVAVLLCIHKNITGRLASTRNLCHWQSSQPQNASCWHWWNWGQRLDMAMLANIAYQPNGAKTLEKNAPPNCLLQYLLFKVKLVIAIHDSTYLFMMVFSTKEKVVISWMPITRCSAPSCCTAQMLHWTAMTLPMGIWGRIFWVRLVFQQGVILAETCNNYFNWSLCYLWANLKSWWLKGAPPESPLAQPITSLLSRSCCQVINTDAVQLQIASSSDIETSSTSM